MNIDSCLCGFFVLFLKEEILMRYQLHQGKMKVMCNKSVKVAEATPSLS